MATLYTQASKNQTRTWMLMGIFLVIVIFIGWFLAHFYGNPMILYIAVGFSIFMNIFSYWYSDKIVLRLAGAKLADRNEFAELYRIVENLSITAGLPMPRVYIVEDSAPNAFATGRDKHHAVVAVTTGLLAILERNELEGVIAHELSHIGNKDILLSTVAAVLVGFISILANMFLHGGVLGGGRNKEGGGIGSVLMIVGVILVILSPIFATLIQLAISRKREYLADASGALLTRYPEGLANALRKISGYARPLAHQSSAIAHIYLADPRGKSAKISTLFMSHPPVQKRIAALLGEKENPTQ